MENLTCTIGDTHGTERVNSDKTLQKTSCIAFKYGQTLFRNVQMCFFIVSKRSIYRTESFFKCKCSCKMWMRSQMFAMFTHLNSLIIQHN